MAELLELVAVAIALFVGTGAMLISPLWWVAIIFAVFAVILTLAVLNRL